MYNGILNMISLLSYLNYSKCYTVGVAVVFFASFIKRDVDTIRKMFIIVNMPLLILICGIASSFSSDNGTL